MYALQMKPKFHLSINPCLYCVAGSASATNGIATVAISDLQCGVTYTIIAEGKSNRTLVGPGSSHGNVTAGPCPSEFIALYMHVQKHT